MEVLLLAELALPLTVDEVLTWDEVVPDRLTVAAAEAALMGRALPLAVADLAACRSDLWPSAKAAERFMEDRCRFETPQPLMRGTYKGLGGFKTLTLARYRRGLRGRWSSALVPLECGRAALEALIGPLSAYEAIVAEQVAQPPAEPAADVVDAPAPPLRPSLALVPVSPAVQRARLAALRQRLDAVQPKPAWGIRQIDWRAWETEARAAATLSRAIGWLGARRRGRPGRDADAGGKDGGGMTTPPGPIADHGDIPMTTTPPPDVEVRATGRLSDYSGSKSPAFTNSLLNAVISTAWLPNGGDQEAKTRQAQITLEVLREFKPADAIEGMIAAQAMAMHQGAMECFRRSMIPDQPLRWRRGCGRTARTWRGA